MSTAQLQLSRYAIASPPFFDRQTRTIQRVILSGRSGRTLVVGEAVWKTLLNYPEELANMVDSSVINLLLDSETIVYRDEDELKFITTRNITAEQDNNVLYQVIHPSAYCQLGCDYCGQVHSKIRLPENDQDILIANVRKILEGERYSELYVSWFGGEPLLGMQVIRRMSQSFQDMCTILGKRFRAKIVTNGVLLSLETARELVNKHRIGFVEVTLDGDDFAHNQRRHTKNGKPTFSKIFENLTSIASDDTLEFHLRVRCNVDRSNAGSVSPLLHLLADAGLNKRCDFYVAPVHAWGNDAHLSAFPHDEFAKREIDWIMEMYELGFHTSLLPSRKSIVCMAAQRDAAVTDSHGLQYNCTEVSYVPSYNNEKLYQIGSLKEGINPKKRDELQAFPLEIANGEHPCSTCEILPLCGGSCPKQWKEGLSPCPPIKANLSEKLLLWYTIEMIERGIWVN